MSNIIAFEPKRGGRAAAGSTPEAGQILFFTGVRYVREIDLDTFAGEDRATPFEEIAHEADRDAQVERLLA